MVDEVGVVKGLRGYGIKEEFAHAKSATAAMGAEDVSTLCQMSKCGEGEELVFIRGLYDVGPLRPTPAQAGMLLRRGWFGRLREGFVPNVEMCELEKEMDKDESVVFRLGWSTR
jgi:hypothetical protein